MKLLLSVIILIFGFQSWTKADDVSEFEIEGMSIGESLLNFMSEKQITEALESEKAYFYENKFVTISSWDNRDKYETYDNVGIILKQDDNVTVESNFNKILDYDIEEVKVENKIKVYQTTFGIADYDPGETYASSLVRTSIILNISYINLFLIYISQLDFSKH